MKNRTSIPAQLEREVLIEAGHRCAIPTCKNYPVDIHHIVPYETCRKHVFDNLIALCSTCHARYHRYRDIDRKSLQIYKVNLGLLNSRYGEFVRRLSPRSAPLNHAALRLIFPFLTTSLS
jgi:hypothetical protein